MALSSFFRNNAAGLTSLVAGPGRVIADLLNPFGNPLTGSRKPTGAQPNAGDVLDGRSRRSLDPTPMQPQQPDIQQLLFQQLIDNLQQPVAAPTGIDTADLMRQVQAAINPIYDQRINSARDQTKRSTGEVQNMYRALSQDFERLAPEQIAQADAAKKEIEQMYGQLRSNIEGSYARVSKDQGDLFKQLGIEAALPSVLDQQDDAVTDALRAASENQAQQQQRYMDIGQMDSTYYREGAPNAVLTGNEISQDLLFQLEQFVNQANAERSAGIQSGYLDQLSNAQNQLLQQQQMAQQENNRRQEMLFQILQGSMKNQGQPQELNVDTFMAQLPQGAQENVANAFTRLQRAPEAVYGKVEDKRNPVPGSFVETTPEWYLSQADAMLQQGQIDAATHQQLLLYIQLYFGLGNR